MMEFCYGNADKIQMHTSHAYRPYWLTKRVCIGIPWAYLELQSTLQTSHSSEMAFIVLLYREKIGTEERLSHLHNEIDIRRPKVPFEAQNIVFNLRDKHKL